MRALAGMILLSFMELIGALVDVILNLDTHLSSLVNQYGVLTYAMLFGVIFAETGFVITPFLPGDSLLFAAGAIASLGSLNVGVVIIVLILAAVLGDTVNYWIGHFFGRKIVDNPNIKFINQEHIDKTEQFYKKYGGKTIILARFVPIVRTFAPFVAGVGTMEYSKFILYNILGGVLWVTIFTLLGYLFGNMPIVQENFHYAVFGVIALSLVPIAYEYIAHKRHPNVPGVSTKNLHKILKK
ncbi:MAG: DedA family membrane protein [Candidatus Gottesmanbacteria bacterium GW2011_GWA1_48_13]|uniref:DedA family membrane protein n=3 Tax=Candidatus Gottesmaniibacteriota TaxID=1752720 RepID=A0A0G1XML3_9BACT|nr:MAG: DedA family membrane protein [Candidatus Gottesmanbacteria bacterium GW2011_GWA1_48_13]